MDTDNISIPISSDLQDELDALKAIYGNEICFDFTKSSVIRITFYLSNNVFLNIFINEDYPKVCPSITCNIDKILKALQYKMGEYSESSMLYMLISDAIDIYKDLPHDVSSNHDGGNCDESSQIQSVEEVKHPKKSEKIRKVKHPDAIERRDGGECKKKSMRTAIDVINRVLWDESLSTENFIVGYLDRFTGIQEKPFTAFSWEDIASVDYNVLAIPKHRIQYFKYKQAKIWDKNDRFDYVFGSTGHTTTLAQIIEDSDNKGKEELQKDLVLSDIETEDVFKEKDKAYNDKNRPNYFLCLPVTDKNVIENLLKVQNHILSCDNRLQDGMVSKDCFHITLCMFRLENEREKEKIGHLLKELQHIFVCMLSRDTTVLLNVNNIGNFRGVVVCAMIEFDKIFHKFVDIVKLKLKMSGIRLLGNHDPYSPHVTLLKLRRPMAKQFEIDQISPFLYDEFQNMSFGTQELVELKVCSTATERGPDGFYITIGSFRNSILSISNHLPNLISKYVSYLMGEGLILEDVGDGYIDALFSSDSEKIDLVLQKLQNSLQYLNVDREKTVLIMRGLPGSGKSFLVKKLHETIENGMKVTVCSADMYFESQGNDYTFCGADISNAHQFCREQFINGLLIESDLIIVDNAHVQCWEYRIYQKIALLCGYKFYIVEIPCESISKQRFFQQRCQHKISGHIHKEMYDKWEADDATVKVASDYMLSLNDVMSGYIYSKANWQNSCILYTALYLDENSSSLLLDTFPPTHSIVSGDHMTISYSPSKAQLEDVVIGTRCHLKVTGYINNSRIQAVAVQEIGRALCTLGNAHVTISRNSTTPAKEAQKWLKSDIQWRPLKEIMLSGVVGVQVAINKTESISCIDPSKIVDLMSQVKENDSNLSPPAEEETSNHFSRHSQQTETENLLNVTVNDHTLFKTAQKKCTDKDISTRLTSSVDDSDAGMYFGPRIIKSIFVFDFDGTLFHTPGPVQGRNDYKKLTGTAWSHRRWLGQVQSLQFPLHVLPGPTLEDYFEHYNRACSMSVLLTGRIEHVRRGVENITNTQGMNFERIKLKPQEHKNEKKEYGGNSVYSYKKNYVASLLAEFSSVDELYFWDDRIDNIKSIRSLQREFPHVKFHLRHVQENNPDIYKLKPEELLTRMGRRQSKAYTNAVREAITFVNKAWMDVLSTSHDQSENIKIFGSYLLGRKSDLDLCILAPLGKSNGEYTTLLSEKLAAFGVRYMHVAANIRSPRIRVKFEFLSASPVECDITIATILKNESSLVLQNMKVVYDKSDSTNKTTLEGLILLEEVVKSVEYQISLHDFGVIVDLVCVALEQKRLKGNAFHCIRTFHIVKLLSTFLNVSNVVPLEGFTTVKVLEKVFMAFLQYLSSIGFGEWKILFKNFVPDLYIQPLIDYFKQCASLGSTLESILFTAPSPLLHGREIQIKLESLNDVELWRAMVLAEAYLGSYIRKLIEQGIIVNPGSILKDSITFSVNNVEQSKKTLDRLVASLQKDLHNSVVVKIIYN